MLAAAAGRGAAARRAVTAALAARGVGVAVWAVACAVAFFVRPLFVVRAVVLAVWGRDRAFSSLVVVAAAALRGARAAQSKQ